MGACEGLLSINVLKLLSTETEVLTASKSSDRVERAQRKRGTALEAACPAKTGSTFGRDDSQSELTAAALRAAERGDAKGAAFWAAELQDNCDRARRSAELDAQAACWAYYLARRPAVDDAASSVQLAERYANAGRGAGGGDRGAARGAGQLVPDTLQIRNTLVAGA